MASVLRGAVNKWICFSRCDSFHHWQFILIALPISSSPAITVSLSSLTYSPEASLLKMCIRRPVMLPTRTNYSISPSPLDWHYWFSLMPVILLNNLRCLAGSVFVLIRSLSRLDVFFDKTYGCFRPGADLMKAKRCKTSVLRAQCVQM